MACHHYEPNIPKPPLPTTGTRFQFRDKDVGTGFELAHHFFSFYNRTPNQALPVLTKTQGVKFRTNNWADVSDTVVLTDKQCAMIRKDPEVTLALSAIRRSVFRRIRQHASTMLCNKKSCFTDGGVQISGTDPFSGLSYGLGHFSLYWDVHVDMGPKKCGLDLKSCKAGMGSKTPYTVTLNCTIYDCYDFTGFQQVLPPTYFGTDFHVVGEFSLTFKGVQRACEKPKYEYGKACGEPISFTKPYDILYGIASAELPAPAVGKQSIIDTAMLKAWADAKSYCSASSCSDADKECLPILSDVELVATLLFEKTVNDKTEYYCKVVVSADISCYCMKKGSLVVPKPSRTRWKPQRRP